MSWGQIWTWLSDPENQKTLRWLGGGVVVIAGGAWTAYLHFSKRGSLAAAAGSSGFIFTWRYRPEDRDWVPFRRTILLKEAARLAYEKLRGRSVSAQKLPAMAADMKFEGEAKPLSWFGYAILGSGDIPVFGSHPPSTKLEIVPKKMTEASGALSDDVNSIHYYGEKIPEYISLTIKRADFRRRLKEITSWHGDGS